MAQGEGKGDSPLLSSYRLAAEYVVRLKQVEINKERLPEVLSDPCHAVHVLDRDAQPEYSKAPILHRL